MTAERVTVVTKETVVTEEEAVTEETVATGETEVTVVTGVTVVTKGTVVTVLTRDSSDSNECTDKRQQVCIHGNAMILDYPHTSIFYIVPCTYNVTGQL